MYRVTTTAGLDQRVPTAPDALDTLDAHLRDQLVDVSTSIHIDWTITPPTGPAMNGWASTPGTDPMIEANLDALHHGLVDDLAITLYEASRAPQTGR